MTSLFDNPAESGGPRLVELAKAGGVIPRDWTPDAVDAPTGIEIHEAVSFIKFSMRTKGEGLLKSLEGLPANYRGHVLLALYPEITIGPPIVKTKRDSWNHKFQSATGDAWSRLYKYYIDVLGWDFGRLSALDQQSDEVLFNLQDPDLNLTPDGPIKGLVVGYVQSGKTANYTAVTAKAFDAGYRMVVILTGVHNALRRQTQLRMEAELGLVPSTDRRPSASPNGQDGMLEAIYPLSNSDMYGGDSIPAATSNSVASNNRTIFVIKKNVSVLRKLLAWLPRSHKFPVLIIDDEADQASVNTNTSEEVVIDEDGKETTVKAQRTATNAAITELVKRFDRVTYVGYTATPYANVFVDAEDDDDLYPKDFIIALPKPNGYFGPKEFFGDSVAGAGETGTPNSSSMVELVDSEETQFFRHADAAAKELKAEGLNGDLLDLNLELPPGLKAAVRRYFLSASAYQAMSEAPVPSAMLVQASQMQEVQLMTSELLKQYTMELRADWRFNKKNAEGKWESDWAQLVESFQSPHTKQFTWNDVKVQLDMLLGQYVGLEVLCLNFKSPDELDYELRPTFSGIVVGGNKLSRGLTIEGLLTSYFVREAKSPNADTLSQMGRFFGYRKRYADLVHVYTTEALLQDFRDVAFVEEELREELKLYSRTPGMTPRDFGPRVALRGRLMPTSKGLGSLAEPTFTGAVLQTSLLVSKDSHRAGAEGASAAHKNNFQSASDLVTKLSVMVADGEITKKESPGNEVFMGCPADAVLNFLKGYEAETESNRFQPMLISKYVASAIRAEATSGASESDHSTWNVALIGTQRGFNGHAFLGGLQINRSRRSLRKGSLKGDIGSLINPLSIDRTPSGDETVDLDLDEAALFFLKEEQRKGMQLSSSLRLHFRNNPLLCIYAIDPNSRSEQNENRSNTRLGEALFGTELAWPEAIIGLTVFFPRDSEQKTVYLQGNARGKFNG